MIKAQMVYISRMKGIQQITAFDLTLPSKEHSKSDPKTTILNTEITHSNDG